MDLSEQLHRLSDDLRDQMERLRVTLQSIGDAVISTDDHGRIALMNPVAEDLTGWSQPEALGRPISEVFQIINELTQLPVENPCERALREGVVLGLANHTILIARDGRKHAIDDSAAPIKDKQGRIVGAVFVFRDVTEKRQLELARSRLAAIVESSDDAIISKTLDGTITSWNNSAERLFGYTAAEAIGQPISMLAPEDRVDEMPAILARLRRGERIDHFHTVRRRKNGEIVHISLTVSPIRNDRGEVVGASKIVRDISENMRLAAERERLLASEQAARLEAERADAIKDEFLATVSHEVRTPLNAILGWTHLLQSGRLSADEVREGLEIIERNTRVQARIIEDLLDMSRIMSGKISLEIVPVELQSVIESALAALRPAADANGLVLQTKFEGTSGSVLGDPGRLEQVISNLLSNAIKFTPSGGRVEIRLTRAGSHVEIEVADTGRGIAPDFLSHVFERFRQADSSSRREHGGLGLGLAIVKQLVELHGGTVQASSPGEGQGATFTVVLPMHGLPESESLLPAAGAPGDSPSLAQVKIVAVDDNLDTLHLVQRVLSSCGALVAVANCASKGFELLKHVRPHVLVSDIGMAGEDGYDLIKKVRALDAETGGNTPAAALTAFARPDDRKRILLAGFQTHIPKPIDPPELIAAVAALAGRAGR